MRVKEHFIEAWWISGTSRVRTIWLKEIKFHLIASFRKTKQNKSACLRIQVEYTHLREQEHTEQPENKQAQFATWDAQDSCRNAVLLNSTVTSTQANEDRSHSPHRRDRTRFLVNSGWGLRSWCIQTIGQRTFPLPSSSSARLSWGKSTPHNQSPLTSIYGCIYKYLWLYF